MKKWFMRSTLILIGLLASLVLSMVIAFRMVHRTNGALVSSGEKRTYLLYVPETYDPATPTPLVISMHGFAEWPAHQMQISGWNDLAEKYGFIVVYPTGTRFPLRWRAYAGPGNSADFMKDVTFISDLIDHLASEYNVDLARVYANGLSNGGGMAFVLSCRLSERIAAIGTVAGAYLFAWEACQPSRPVPTIVFHGTADPIVPYQGGSSSAFRAPFPSIPQWVDALAHQNGCTGAPLALPGHGEVSGVHFNHCASNGEVVFYTIAGGGHSWPGGEPIPEWIVGRTTQAIDATQVMWDFFRQHPLDDRK